MMQIRLFAGAREAAQSDSVEIEIELPATVEALSKRLAAAHPSLAPYVGFSRFAIGNAFVDVQYVIQPDDLKSEIALIPPVSGG